MCVRFESTAITSGWAPSIEVLAFGTALIPASEAARFVGTGRSRLLGEGSIRTRAVGARPA